MSGGILVALFMAVGIVGLLEAAGRVPLPMTLLGLRSRMPTLFTLHMATSSLALLLLGPVLATRRRPRLHRPLGRLMLAAVAVGGLTAIPTALASDAGDVARAGFLAQAAVWLGFAAVGLGHVRAGRIEHHRAAMVKMAAVTSGAVVLRGLLVLAAVAGLDVQAAYGWIAWAAWTIPLALVSLGPLRATPREKSATTGAFPVGAPYLQRSIPGPSDPKDPHVFR